MTSADKITVAILLITLAAYLISHLLAKSRKQRVLSKSVIDLVTALLLFLVSLVGHHVRAFVFSLVWLTMGLLCLHKWWLGEDGDVSQGGDWK